MDVKKIIAACCSGAAVLLMLALPVLRISAMDRSLLALSGADLLSEGAMAMLIPLLYAAGMAACALLLDGKISAGICFGGVLVPPIAMAILKDQVVNAVTGNSFDIPGEITSILVRISMGEGFILMILLAAAAGVLCLLAGLTRKARKTTAGLTSGDEEEW